MQPRFWRRAASYKIRKIKKKKRVENKSRFTFSRPQREVLHVCVVGSHVLGATGAGAHRGPRGSVQDVGNRLVQRHGIAGRLERGRTALRSSQALRGLDGRRLFARYLLYPSRVRRPCDRAGRQVELGGAGRRVGHFVRHFGRRRPRGAGHVRELFDGRGRAKGRRDRVFVTVGGRSVGGRSVADPPGRYERDGARQQQRQHRDGDDGAGRRRRRRRDGKTHFGKPSVSTRAAHHARSEVFI